MLKGKHIIVGITGSIAAYKAASLVRLLVKEGAEVKVVMTELAKQFITPLTLATLSKHPVMVEFYNPENGDWHSHVDMGLWADLYLIAPATANTLGKMAHGIADNLLLTTYLSAKCPVMVAPAMDLDMYCLLPWFLKKESGRSKRKMKSGMHSESICWILILQTEPINIVPLPFRVRALK